MTSSEAFRAMTCRELKIELKKREPPTGGLKRDLLEGPKVVLFGVNPARFITPLKSHPQP